MAGFLLLSRIDPGSRVIADQNNSLSGTGFPVRLRSSTLLRILSPAAAVFSVEYLRILHNQRHLLRYFNLEKPCNCTVFVNIDVHCSRLLRKTWHRHDTAGDGHYESSASRNPYLTDG